jgi:potassium-dependent mechanosensitive channel
MMRYLRLVVFLSIAAAIRPGLSQTVTPQSTPVIAPSAAVATAPVDSKAKHKEVTQRLEAAQQDLDAAKQAATPDSRLIEQLSNEVEMLKQLDALCAELESSDDSRKELEVARADSEKKLADLRQEGLSEPRPYSYLMLDGLRDALATQESRGKEIDDAVAAASEELEHAKDDCDKAQAERRRIKEESEKNKDHDRAHQLSGELRLAQLQAELAEQTVAVRRAELDDARRSHEVEEVHATLLKETLACIERDAVFSAADLQKVLIDIEKQEADLKQELQAAESMLQSLTQQSNAARQKLDAAGRKAAAAMVEEEKTAKLARFCQTRRVALLQKQLEFLSLLRQAWNHRFELATGKFEVAELSEWDTETARALEQLGFERRLEEILIDETRKELSDLDRREEAAKQQDAELDRWIDQEQLLYDQLIEAHSASLVKLDAHGKTHQKLRDEIRQKNQHRSLAEWFAVSRNTAANAWYYELTHFEDGTVTVGKVIKGLTLLIVGVWLSRRFTHGLARKVLLRMGVQEGVAEAVQSLTFYLLTVISALMALHMVHVPLTIFTFMGGAVAIGVGFGSQKILNNFISGVILLVESPIRVGDLIELGTLMGKVHSIGTRSTRIRTGSNLEIIVPNSALLENNVINWTLTDTTVRTSIRVGVAYGSTTRETARWLKHAADEHGQVLKKPEPFVWFTNFGDNTLDFELYFWIDIRASDRRRVESDLRFMIDEYLRDAGITIAFPQRDVHLDISKPLQVALLPSAAAPAVEASTTRKAA